VNENVYCIWKLRYLMDIPLMYPKICTNIPKAPKMYFRLIGQKFNT